MLFCTAQSNGVCMLFEYQWARIERVQGCSLTSLCLPSAASDSQRKSRGIITAWVQDWEYVREKHLIQTPALLFFKRMLNWPEGNRGKLFSFPFVQQRLQGNGQIVKTSKLDLQFEFHLNIKLEATLKEKLSKFKLSDDTFSNCNKCVFSDKFFNCWQFIFN